MPYPDEIIETLQKKYSMPDLLKNQLIMTLMSTKVKEAIEKSALNPEQLLIKTQHKPPCLFVCSPFAALQIINNTEFLSALQTSIDKQVLVNR